MSDAHLKGAGKVLFKALRIEEAASPISQTISVISLGSLCLNSIIVNTESLSGS
jgi:hypothetical protein